VAWGFGTPAEMRLAGAGHVAHTMAELEAELAAFKAGLALA
jgi:hypothetical protein